MTAHNALWVALPALLLAVALPLTLAAQQAEAQGPGQAAPAVPGAVAVVPASPQVPAGGGAVSAQPSQPPPAWLPRQTAELQIVEKVNATYRTLDVVVGKTAEVDKLAISVKACVVRPPGQQDDAAAYLEITGKNAQPASSQAPSFVGWMLAAEPAVSLFKDPLYDVRLVGCR